MAKKPKAGKRPMSDAEKAALAKTRAQIWASDTSGRSYDEMFQKQINVKERAA